jgi:hypothetical protein
MIVVVRRRARLNAPCYVCEASLARIARRQRRRAMREKEHISRLHAKPDRADLPFGIVPANELALTGRSVNNLTKLLPFVNIRYQRVVKKTLDVIGRAASISGGDYERHQVCDYQLCNYQACDCCSGRSRLYKRPSRSITSDDFGSADPVHGINPYLLCGRPPFHPRPPLGRRPNSPTR